MPPRSDRFVRRKDQLREGRAERKLSAGRPPFPSDTAWLPAAPLAPMFGLHLEVFAALGADPRRPAQDRGKVPHDTGAHLPGKRL